MVGKPQNAIPLALQPGIPPRIMLGIFRMKWPVSLYDQPMAKADKVRDIAADRRLAAEF